MMGIIEDMKEGMEYSIQRERLFHQFLSEKTTMSGMNLGNDFEVWLKKREGVNV